MPVTLIRSSSLFKRSQSAAPVAVSFGLAAALLIACGDSGASTTGGQSSPSGTGSTGPKASASSAASSAPSASASSSASAAPVSSSSSAPSASAVASTGPANSSAPVAVGSSAPDAVKGEAKKQPAYSAYMGGSKSYKAGQAGAVVVVVSAGEGYHINQEYKYKMKMDAPPSGVTYASDTVTNASKSEKQATMSIPFTPSAPGSYTLSGTCSLGVCQDSACVVDKVPLTVTVTVTQ